MFLQFNKFILENRRMLWPMFIHDNNFVGKQVNKFVNSVKFAYFLIVFSSDQQLKSFVQKRPKWQFWTNLHKTSKLSTFLQCYSSQMNRIM